MDWKLIATTSLKKYNGYRISLVVLPQLISAYEDDLKSLKAVDYDRVPSNCKQYGVEGSLAENLDMQEFLKLRYEALKKRTYAIDQAYLGLNTDEKIILDEYYKRESGTIADLAEKLHLSESSIYDKKNAALYKFAIGMGLVN